MGPKHQAHKVALKIYVRNQVWWNTGVVFVGIKPRTSHVIDKCSTTELHPSACCYSLTLFVPHFSILSFWDSNYTGCFFSLYCLHLLFCLLPLSIIFGFFFWSIIYFNVIYFCTESFLETVNWVLYFWYCICQIQYFYLFIIFNNFQFYTQCFNLVFCHLQCTKNNYSEAMPNNSVICCSCPLGYLVFLCTGWYIINCWAFYWTNCKVIWDLV